MAAVNKPNAYQTYYMLCFILFLLFLLDYFRFPFDFFQLRRDVRNGFVDNHVIVNHNWPYTPFVAAFELLLGTLRTGLLVVSDTLVPDFRVVVDCCLVS